MAGAVRDWLLDRAAFLIAFLITVALTTALIVIVTGNQPAPSRLIVRPAPAAGVTSP